MDRHSIEYGMQVTTKKMMMRKSWMRGNYRTVYDSGPKKKYDDDKRVSRCQLGRNN